MQENQNVWTVQAVWISHDRLRIECYSPESILTHTDGPLRAEDVPQLAEKIRKIYEDKGRTVSVELEALEISA